jgi:hypothetical protein
MATSVHSILGLNPMPDTLKMRALDAVDTLTDFIGDLIAGVMVLREYVIAREKGCLEELTLITIRKMCLSHVVLTLCKFHEFWQHYKDLVPLEHREAAKDILKTLEKKKIKDLRNKWVGHIWDKDRKRPLIHSEIIERFDILVDGDLSTFLDWINNPKNNTYPTTVVSIVEEIRNSIMTTHGISLKEIIAR